MRAILAGLVLLCLMSVQVDARAEARATDTVTLKSIKDTLVTLADGERLSLYGVRLWGGPSGHAHAGEELLRKRLSAAPFRIDSGAFAKSHFARNRYGDLHAMVFSAKGDWLQEELIKAGYGWWSGAASYPPALRRRLIAAEKKAMKARRGLWFSFSVLKAQDQVPSDWDGRFVVVEGRVQEVYRSAKYTYLNFGSDWRHDFTVAVPARDRKNFARESWKLSDLVHKLVSVRGILRFYNGPYLEISFSEQLEIVEDGNG